MSDITNVYVCFFALEINALYHKHYSVQYFDCYKHLKNRFNSYRQKMIQITGYNSILI